MNIEQFASRGLKAQIAVDALTKPKEREIDLSCDFEPTWRARVEVRQGNVTMRRFCEVPARDADQARERMEMALSVVWKDFEIIGEPMLKEEGKR